MYKKKQKKTTHQFHLPKYDEVSIRNCTYNFPFPDIVRVQTRRMFASAFSSWTSPWTHSFADLHITKNDDRWNCRKLIFQKYNVYRITITQKIRTNLKPRQAYLLQHSYYKVPVKLEPKFGHFIHKISLHTTTQLLQGSSEAGAKIWLFYTQDKAYTLQHSYSKAPVKLEPKFGHFIHKTKPTHYNTATPRLKWRWSQNLVILYTRQSLHTTTQLLQGSSEGGAKI